MIVKEISLWAGGRIRVGYEEVLMLNGAGHELTDSEPNTVKDDRIGAKTTTVHIPNDVDAFRQRYHRDTLFHAAVDHVHDDNDVLFDEMFVYEHGGTDIEVPNQALGIPVKQGVVETATNYVSELVR